jgi:hypothetical protein
VYLLFRPENFVPHPIGEIDELGLLQFHHFGSAEIESRKMAADNAIAETCLM